jgi:hypothetical protein
LRDEKVLENKMKIQKYLSHLTVPSRLEILSYEVSDPSPRYNFNETIVFMLKIGNMEPMQLFASSKNYEDQLEIGFNVFRMRVSSSKDYFSLTLLRNLVEKYRKELNVFLPAWTDEIRIQLLKDIFENSLNKVCITFHNDIAED